MNLYLYAHIHTPVFKYLKHIVGLRMNVLFHVCMYACMCELSRIQIKQLSHN